jgi:hypothetical protein
MKQISHVVLGILFVTGASAVGFASLRHGWLLDEVSREVASSELASIRRASAARETAEATLVAVKILSIMPMLIGWFWIVAALWTKVPIWHGGKIALIWPISIIGLFLSLWLYYLAVAEGYPMSAILDGVAFGNLIAFGLAPFALTWTWLSGKEEAGSREESSAG